jgi:hypothetical protein
LIHTVGLSSWLAILLDLAPLPPPLRTTGFPPELVSSELVNSAIDSQTSPESTLGTLEVQSVIRGQNRGDDCTIWHFDRRVFRHAVRRIRLIAGFFWFGAGKPLGSDAI